MLHARPDYNRIQDPLGLIPENEPVFLLRASDVSAPAIVEAWAGLAEATGAKKDIVSLARNQAKLMRQWQANHGSKVPDLNQHTDNDGCGACFDACNGGQCRLLKESPPIIGVDWAKGQDETQCFTLGKNNNNGEKDAN